ncbi:MAG: hypothetical protein HRU09_01845 [Oligoflexales bacterium]|nr:hypothetical protein [Oligoflexales bacterium]
MKKNALTFIVMFYPFFSYGENIQINKVMTSYETEVVSQDKDEIIIRFELGNIDRERKLIGHESFSKLEIQGASYLREPSYPELPKVTLSLALPNAHNIKIKVLSAESKILDLGIPAPSKGDLERSVNPTSVPYTFSSLYDPSLNSFKKISTYPLRNAKLSEPYMLGRVQGVNLTIYPLQYLPVTKKFKINSSMLLKITFQKSEIIKSNSLPNPSFESLYKTRFYNWTVQKENKFQQANPVSSPSGKILIVAGDQFLNSDLEEFALWKRQLGYEVKLIKMSEAGSSSIDLKSYIQAEYDLDGLLSYVILVGDAEHVPFYKGTAGNARNNEADPMYGLVEGDDSYPDLIVGRISVKNADDLKNILSKSIDYEKSPSHGEWFRNALGIASDEGSPSDGERADYLKEVLLASEKYDQVESLYDPAVNATEIMEAINAGQSLINYIGHGYETAWVTGSFKNRHIERLSNGSRLPVIISVACVNGRFSYPSEDSFAEKWLKVGEAGKPQGAVAIFASSTNQSWVPPTIGQLEISRLIASGQVYTVGTLMMNGSIAVLQDGSYSAKQTFQTWHIFGDPSLEFRSDVPSQIEVSQLDESLKWGNSFDLGEQGLRLSITDGKNLIFTQKSDQDGMIYLPQANSDLNKVLTLTISGKNKVPLVKKMRATQN